MHFRLLGGLEVVDDGRPVDLGGPKQRAVLASLLLDLGRPVSPARLEEQVWGDRPPANPETSLQAYVSNLRRALEPGRRPREAARLLVTQPAGYALLAPPVDVDVARFEDLAALGREALAAGDAAGARRAFDDALALWRGEPVPEFAGEPWIEVVAGRLHDVRAQVQELRFDAGLRLGEHAALVPDIEAAVAAHPYRERLRAQLALALYRSGRQRDALASLAEARRALAEDIGIDPGPELRQLEADILGHAAGLDLAPVPAAPEVVAPAAPSPAPTPVAEAGTASTFVGRARELQVLLDAAAEAARGQGRPVVVSGEPGIGKTRLVEELVARLPGDTVVAWGRCPESAASAAYWPCIQIGRQLEGADALDGDLAARLVPSDGMPRLGDDPTADRLSLHLLVVKLLASSTRPLVVVVDDLQWADPASLRLIEFVAGELRGTNALLLVTVRPVPADAPAPLIDCLGELARQPGAARIELDGLGTDDVHRWVTERGSRGASGDVAALVHDRTGGNPFFVGEVVELLAGEGRLADPDAARRGAAVPAGVQDVIRRRVGRLPADTQQLLAAASVVGRTFDADVLGAVSGTAQVDVLELVEPALAAGLVDETDLPGRFQFAHALVAETLESELSAARRARLHAATAAALAELRAADIEGHVAELAHHAYEGAVAGTAAEAYEWSVKAARQAEARVAHEDAALHWGRAVHALARARPADRRARYEALVEQGRAWLRVDDVGAGYEALVAAIDLAIAMDEPELVARAAAAMSIDGLWQAGEIGLTASDAVSALERATAAMAPGPSPERVLALATWAENAYWQWPVTRLDEVTAEAVAVAREVGDPIVLGRALHKRNQVLWWAGTLDQRRDAAFELLELTERQPVPPELEALALVGAAGVDWEVGDARRAGVRVARSRELAHRLRSPALMTQLDYFQATLHAFTGRLAEAEVIADQAHELYRRTRRWIADALHAGLTMPILLEQHRLDEIIAASPALLDTDYRPWFQEAYAVALVEHGRLDEAADLVGPGLPPLTDSWLFLGLLGAAAHVRVALGDRASATILRQHLEPFAGRLTVSGTGPAWGDAHFHLAAIAHLLGDEEDARRHADASVGVLTFAGAGPHLVRALLQRAELLPEGADADLRLAGEIVERLDLPLLRDRLVAVG